MVARACMMRTPVDPQSEIRGTIYGMDGIAPGFLRECQSWEDRIPAEEDEAGTSGGGGASETGTWKTVDDDGRFPSLVDLFLHHGRLLGILNIITKSRLSSLNLVTVPKMPNLSLTPLKPSCHPQHDMSDTVLKYAIALLNK